MWSRWNLVRRHEWRKLGRSIYWGPPFDETILRYDHTGRRVGQREIILGTLHSSEGWLYDDAGRVVEHRFCDEQDQLVSLDAYTYRTNERGDWIERLMNRSRPDGTDEFVQKTMRAIEYAM